MVSSACKEICDIASASNSRSQLKYMYINYDRASYIAFCYWNLIKKCPNPFTLCPTLLHNLTCLSFLSPRTLAFLLVKFSIWYIYIYNNLFVRVVAEQNAFSWYTLQTISRHAFFRLIFFLFVQSSIYDKFNVYACAFAFFLLCLRVQFSGSSAFTIIFELYNFFHRHFFPYFITIQFASVFCHE